MCLVFKELSDVHYSQTFPLWFHLSERHLLWSRCHEVPSDASSKLSRHIVNLLLFFPLGRPLKYATDIWCFSNWTLINFNNYVLNEAYRVCWIWISHKALLKYGSLFYKTTVAQKTVVKTNWPFLAVHSYFIMLIFVFPFQTQGVSNQVINPCYPPKFNISINLGKDVFDSVCTKKYKPANWDAKRNVTVVGSGNYQQCVNNVTEIFTFSNCSYSMCSFDGVFQPRVTGSFMVRYEQKQIC